MNELLTGRTDAEQSVIGSMLIDDRCVPLVLRKMRPEDFTDGTCRSTFRAIQKLVREGRPVDPVTVVDAMSGGDAYVRWIRELMEATPTAANVEAYIDVSQRGAALYHLREFADKILLCTDLEDAQAHVRKMSSLLSATSRMPRMTAAELAQDFLERMKKPRPEYLPWGFPTADKEAFAEPGDLILLGGYPSAGKTLTSILMALAQAKRYRVGYYTLETKPEKMADRIFAHLAGVSLGKIKTRDFGEKEWGSFAEATNQFVSYCPFDIIHAAGSTVDDIAADAIGNNYQIVYVDYAQLIKVPGIRPDNRYAIVTEVSQALKTFGRQNNIAVVALAQLQRPETISKKGAEEKLVPPNMSSFRESGQLEQDADLAFLLWPMDPDDNQGRRKMKLAKNKEGRKFTVELDFHGATQTMVEVAPPPVSAQYSAIGRDIKSKNRTAAQKAQANPEAVPDDQFSIVTEEDDNPFTRG